MGEMAEGSEKRKGTLSFEDEVTRLEGSIREVEVEIGDVVVRLGAVEKQIEDKIQERKGADATKAEELREELQSLRKKEEQLRKEKEQLRKEKEQLRKEEEQLREKELILLRQTLVAGPSGELSQPLAEGGVIAFWRELSQCSRRDLKFKDRVEYVEPKGNRSGKHLGGQSYVLKLPNGTKWLSGVCPGGDTLYVRACYELFWDIISIDKDSHLVKGWAITGTPGIGKSGLLLYVMWKLRASAKRIVFQSAKRQQRILFEGNNVVAGDAQAFARQLSDEGTWYLVDGCNVTCYPVECEAPTVLCQSPNDQAYKEWAKKLSVTKLCMPTWAMDELEELRSALFENQVTAEQMTELFDQFGGVPRLVLEYCGDTTKQEECRAAVLSCNADVVISGFKKPGQMKEVTSKVLHLVPNRTAAFRGPGTPDFASRWVYTQLTKQASAELLEFARRWARQYRETSHFGGSAGHMFELWAENQLCQPRGFQRKELKEDRTVGTEETVQFLSGPSQLEFLEQRDASAAELLKLQGKCVRAPGRGFNGIDTLILPENKDQPANLFQITLNPNHNIKAKLLDDWLQILRVAGYKHIDLYFVYDELRFDSAHRQLYVTEKNTESVKIKFADVKQYALLVNLDVPRSAGSPPKGQSGSGADHRQAAGVVEEQDGTEIESGSHERHGDRKRKVCEL